MQRRVVDVEIAIEQISCCSYTLLGDNVMMLSVNNLIGIFVQWKRPHILPDRSVSSAYDEMQTQTDIKRITQRSCPHGRSDPVAMLWGELQHN
ncbi:jg6215 [Pararge aegeria aegeria]|uniref:Jg6215 protein n=1 Tax=Pararge aegeria aegeria TaxID=348720 RepID=A0A8S4RNP6_9NEOP|nr:jg6215 [Pararge aegeria aegeria]